MHLNWGALTIICFSSTFMPSGRFSQPWISRASQWMFFTLSKFFHNYGLNFCCMLLLVHSSQGLSFALLLQSGDILNWISSVNDCNSSLFCWRPYVSSGLCCFPPMLQPTSSAIYWNGQLILVKYLHQRLLIDEVYCSLRNLSFVNGLEGALPETEQFIVRNCIGSLNL